MNIIERVKKFDFPSGQYAVFGSALLDLWGIRKANDLDIVVLPELYKKLKSDGWEEKQAHGFCMLVKDDANVTTVQDKPTDGDYFPDREALVKEAVIVKGIPFVKIEEVIACKTSYGRPKDIQDIENIKNYINSKDLEDLYKDF